MISFKQLESGTPPDVEVTTDDADAENIRMEDAFIQAGVADDLVTAINLRDTSPNEEGNFVFIIPGDEVADVADIFEDEDIPLWDQLNKWNAEKLEPKE